jgi:hypothetical protein
MAKSDKKVLDLIAEVNRQKEEIGKAERPVWATNCSFTFAFAGKTNDVFNSFNLHVVKDMQLLIRMASFIVATEKSYSETLQLLAIENIPEFKWDGFSKNDWLADIKLRINQIQIEEKKKKLAELEKRLNAIISPELKAQMEIEAISGELK